GLPLGRHLDLGAGSNVRAGDGVILAIAAQNHRRLRRSTTGPECAGTGAGSRSNRHGRTRCRTLARPALARRAGLTRPAGTGTAGTAGACAAAEGTAGGRKRETADIALADGRVPVALDLAGLLIDGDAVVDAVVDQHVGIGTGAERAVFVAIRSGF